MPEADLKTVHQVIGSDLSLETMGLEYDELMKMEYTLLLPLRELSLSQKVKLLAQSEHYKTVNKVLARVLAAKPLSADVERLISCSNILKSPDRSSIHVETEKPIPLCSLQYASGVPVESQACRCQAVKQQVASRGYAT